MVSVHNSGPEITFSHMARGIEGGQISNSNPPNLQFPYQTALFIPAESNAWPWRRQSGARGHHLTEKESKHILIQGKKKKRKLPFSRFFLYQSRTSGLRNPEKAGTDRVSSHRKLKLISFVLLNNQRWISARSRCLLSTWWKGEDPEREHGDVGCRLEEEKRTTEGNAQHRFRWRVERWVSV